MSGLLRYLSISLLGGAVLWTSGCGPRLPADSPTTAPFSVLVTKGGQPLEGASVFLVPDSHPDSLVCVGHTDSGGIAWMNTNYASFSLKGAPVGNNKVYVVREVDEMHTAPLEERQKMGYDESNAYETARQERRAALPPIVPVSLTSAATTPITATVVPRAEQLKIEINDYE